MVKRLFRILFTLFGLLAGYWTVTRALEGAPSSFVGFLNLHPVLQPAAYIISVALCGLIFFVLSRPFYVRLVRIITWVEQRLQTVPMADVLFGIVGLVLACLIASLMMPLFAGLPEIIKTPFTALTYVVLIYLGVSLLSKRWHEILGASFLKRFKAQEERAAPSVPAALGDKLLDTSVIIDGRVADIVKMGFIEGRVVVPQFVLTELQGIADSSDPLKRSRGRAGLELLARMRRELPDRVTVLEGAGDEGEAVDIRLLKLAQSMGGIIVTNDYNLNKVAGVTGVPVLNINELSNALKIVVLPGEELALTIVKEGKEAAQGVAYLSDGTMVVVEGARHMIGDTLDAVVTSVLQTNAGRMVFAKPKG